MRRLRSARARAAAWVGAALLATAAAPHAVADRLHLEGGGEIVTEQWWIEGETLVYRQADGTVALPRSLVVRIEREVGGAAAPAATAEAPPRPSAPARAV